MISNDDNNNINKNNNNYSSCGNVDICSESASCSKSSSCQTQQDLSQEKCNNCHQYGHHWYQCPEVTCRYCHTYGHIAAQCMLRSDQAIYRSMQYHRKKLDAKYAEFLRNNQPIVPLEASNRELLNIVKDSNATITMAIEHIEANQAKIDAFKEGNIVNSNRESLHVNTSTSNVSNTTNKVNSNLNDITFERPSKLTLIKNKFCNSLRLFQHGLWKHKFIYAMLIAAILFTISVHTISSSYEQSISEVRSSIVNHVIEKKQQSNIFNCAIIGIFSVAIYMFSYFILRFIRLSNITRITILSGLFMTYSIILVNSNINNNQVQMKHIYTNTTDEIHSDIFEMQQQLKIVSEYILADSEIRAAQLDESKKFGTVDRIVGTTQTALQVGNIISDIAFGGVKGKINGAAESYRLLRKVIKGNPKNVQAQGNTDKHQYTIEQIYEYKLGQKPESKTQAKKWYYGSYLPNEKYKQDSINTGPWNVEQENDPKFDYIKEQEAAKDDIFGQIRLGASDLTKPTKKQQWRHRKAMKDAQEILKHEVENHRISRLVNTATHLAQKHRKETLYGTVYDSEQGVKLAEVSSKVIYERKQETIQQLEDSLKQYAEEYKIDTNDILELPYDKLQAQYESSQSPFASMSIFSHGAGIATYVKSLWKGKDVKQVIENQDISNSNHIMG